MKRLRNILVNILWNVPAWYVKEIWEVVVDTFESLSEDSETFKLNRIKWRR